MCLRAIFEPDQMHCLTLTGYKVFAVSDGKLYNIYYGKNKAVPIGIWINSRDYGRVETVDVIKHENISYPAGFHIFEDALDASSFVYDIKKFLWRPMPLVTYLVDYNEVTAVGIDDKDRTVIVARNLKLSREHVKCV